MNQSFIRL